MDVTHAVHCGFSGASFRLSLTMTVKRGGAKMTLQPRQLFVESCDWYIVHPKTINICFK